MGEGVVGRRSPERLYQLSVGEGSLPDGRHQSWTSTGFARPTRVRGRKGFEGHRYRIRTDPGGPQPVVQGNGIHGA